jgi:phosphoribosylformylglycinamidine cyclo-ligase
MGVEMGTVAERHVMYDPGKPLNRGLNEKVERTWVFAKDWNFTIRKDGKRAVTRKMMLPPWVGSSGLSEEMQGSDGIGTKGIYHWQRETYAFAAQDAFAMVANDLIERGFAMYQLQNVLTVESESSPKAKRAVDGVISGLVKIASSHKVVISGGETAAKDTMHGLELDITGTGVRMHKPPTGINEDSVILGLQSNGFNSNGFTDVRRVYDKLRHHERIPIPDALVAPTPVYVNGLRELLRAGKSSVHGLVHITGKGWSKLRELDPEAGYDVHVENKNVPNPVFTDLFRDSKQAGIPFTVQQMYATFNCGIGYVVAVAPRFVEETKRILAPYHPTILTTEIKKAKRGDGRIYVKDDVFSDGAVLRF